MVLVKTMGTVGGYLRIVVGISSEQSTMVDVNKVITDIEKLKELVSDWMWIRLDPGAICTG